MLKSAFDGLCAAAGAAAFSVLPSFIQQYLAGLSAVHGYLSRRNPTADRGASSNPLVDDAYRESLAAGIQSIDESAGFHRLLAFASHFDVDVARDTLRVFKPAVQFTLDGLYLFLAGIIVGLILSNAFAFGCRRVVRRRRTYA
ncbi:MAG: DUF2937 family protein [Proteobacteria bacterium]|nr:DUF2937 family protein [Pseudomonadota bacterium]